MAPNGYHIPTDAEWTTLTTYLGETDAAAKMKSTTGWIEDGNGSKESGFARLPGGYRYHDGSFGVIGAGGNWWSSSEDFADYDWCRDLDYDLGGVNRAKALSFMGFLCVV